MRSEDDQMAMTSPRPVVHTLLNAGDYTLPGKIPTVSVCFHSDAINVPMIPLGLKETKEVDFTVTIQVKTTWILSF